LKRRSASGTQIAMISTHHSTIATSGWSSCQEPPVCSHRVGRAHEHYLRETLVAMGVLSETFETAITAPGMTSSGPIRSTWHCAAPRRRWIRPGRSMQAFCWIRPAGQRGQTPAKDRTDLSARGLPVRIHA
jgi:hypothetical protein